MAISNDIPYQNYPQQQHLEISFQVPQRQPGIATITTKPSSDPELYGVPLLGPQTLGNLSLSDTRGFPIFELSVASQSVGWSAYYGAIQVFAAEPGLPQDLSNANWLHDDHPIFDHVNTPFYDFAANPTFFDYPFHNTRQWDWIARMFIVYVPDAVVSKHVKPIFGVEWGYWVNDSRPYVKETKRLDIKVWNEHLELLRSKFTGWTFDAA